jgi:ABC-type bacteriocin/lantibiotic exporter with double-glycine peptidase domain
VASVLKVPHFRQETDGLCPPACVQMVLAYWGLSHSQSELVQWLGTRPHIGTPHRHINRLRSAEIDVFYAADGSTETLHVYLERGLPVIVFVQVAELPHWQGHSARHALVVIGMEDTSVVVLDPAASPGPIRVPLDDFLLAWEEMDATYAVVSRSA